MNILANRTPSKEEFQQTIDQELGFLAISHGFLSEKNPSNDFERRFVRDLCEISILGGGYGEFAWLEIKVDGKHVPWHLIAPNMQTHLTPKTDAPQLDDIRDIAARLQKYFPSLLEGDYSTAESAWAKEVALAKQAEERREADPKGTFFSDADHLWKIKKWQELIQHLSQSNYKLSKTWKHRLECARKGITNA